MFGKKKVENKSQFKTEAELQRYIDLKINSTILSLHKGQLSSQNLGQQQVIQLLAGQLNTLRERVVHLEKFLGVEFGTETTTGYKLIKKARKK